MAVVATSRVASKLHIDCVLLDYVEYLKKKKKSKTHGLV